MGNTHRINNPNSRIRKKIIEYAVTVESFDLHELHDWWFNNSPKHVPPRNKLSGLLSKMDCLEKVGFQTTRNRRNMKYKLRDEYVVD